MNKSITIFWLVASLFAIYFLWNLFFPAKYTLFLYRKSDAVRGIDLTDQQVSGYSSLKECQEKGVEFTQKGYAKFTCGERCKEQAIGEVDCEKPYY